MSTTKNSTMTSSKSYDEALELAKLLDTGSNSRVSAIQIALSDKSVRELALKYLEQGYHSNGIQFPNQTIGEEERLNFLFLPPAGRMVLMPPQFYVVVDVRNREVKEVVDCL